MRMGNADNGAVDDAVKCIDDLLDLSRRNSPGLTPISARCTARFFVRVPSSPYVTATEASR
jgi:hypothetical protein